MNISIPDSWLREFLKTKATPQEIAKYLSLSSQSVEKIQKLKDDWIYEIEITTNRPDCLSVYGIARELAAILPSFGIKTKLNKIEEENLQIPQLKNGLPLNIKIEKNSLCPRFTAIIFDEIVIKPSPKIIQERLEKSGIRALNNVVDISNYLMLELGQPMHTFDYDKIKNAKMFLRESKEGEKIITLDNQIRILPLGTIIIEDGEGRIIDLCGIMGGKNSAVDKNTQRVLLFVQTYNPQKIRQACQKLAFRTEAAQRFERGVDPEGVILGIKKAIAMFEKNCQARVASNLIDIYPQPCSAKKVSLTQEKLNKVMGISFPLPKAKKILENLGFTITVNKEKLTASVPHWRYDDISIPEDLIEEIARIYGYHQLPNVLPQGKIPTPKIHPIFYWEEVIKTALKFWGFCEMVNYSLVGKNLLEKCFLNPKDFLKVNNPLTEELVYLRPSLIPSLLQNINKNQALEEKINIFEIANVYLPKSKNNLPEEVSTLTVLSTEKNFFQLKGIAEAILNEFGIFDFDFFPCSGKDTNPIFHPHATAKVLVKKSFLGFLGLASPKILNNFSIRRKISLFEFKLPLLIKYATNFRRYQPLPKYPSISEDLSLIIPQEIWYSQIIKMIKSVSPLIKNISLTDSYQNTKTLQIIYQSPNKTLTSKQVEKIRKKIVKKLKEKGIELKTTPSNNSI